jgi:hypothetical protein
MASSKDVDSLKAACYAKYPVPRFPANVLTLGIQGAITAKRRDECLRFATDGKEDPRFLEAAGQTFFGNILDHPDQLWAVEKPWHERPMDSAGQTAAALGAKTGGDVLRSTAKGYKPTNDKDIQDREQKATIKGGLLALQAAGLSPWNELDLDALPPVKLTDDKSGSPLLQDVRSCASRLGDSLPNSIDDAVKYIRRKVIEADLAEVAWFARAMTLATAGATATQKRQAVENGVALGLNVASAAAASTVIGIIAVPFIDMASVTAKGFAARTTIENARAEAEAKAYGAEFNRALEKQSLRVQINLINQQISIATQISNLEKAQAAEEAAKITQYATIASWSAAFGAIGLVGLALYRRKKRRQLRGAS